MNPANTLNALNFPLRGSQLIEASAGTGKTYTIAALYVRLVLGPRAGNSTDFSRALLTPEILVVTFTEAATKELRERIRRRLTEAGEAFLDPTKPVDSFLGDLRGEYQKEDWPACARRLQMAAEWMDEAAVSTIHGWCKRMLSEHAFDSGALFNQRLEPDLSALQEEAARDYWRVFMVPLPTELAAVVQQHFAGPDALQVAVKGLLAHAERLPETPAPAELLSQRQAALNSLKAPWRDWVGPLRTLLDDAHASGLLKYNKAHYPGWLNKLQAWAVDPVQLQPDLSDSAWDKLSADGQRAAWKGETHLAHPALTDLETLRDRLASVPNPEPEPWLLAHATRWIANRIAVLQHQQALMGFDGLLTELATVLQKANGPTLAARIRQQFPVALIDEFQDTDPVQYRIFDAVYRVADTAEDTALILIGDPKQAIYSFRGADIHSYLGARRATAGRWHTLANNFRSTTAMVTAVNHTFAQAEARGEGEGAFLFRQATDNPVPFVEVTAAGQVGRFMMHGEEPPALSFWSLALPEGKTSMNKEDAQRETAACFATEITRLLNLGQQGAATITDKHGERALKPADIAVLVNNGVEARAMQKALRVRDVRSVYLSDRDSVYASAEAGDLQRWLQACAEPGDGQRLRAALATASLYLSWERLEQLRQDELAWEEELTRFQGYRELWRRRGVLPMLRRLMHDFAVPERLLALEGGERALTNLLHLAELMQQAARTCHGEHALIRFLAQERVEAQSAGGGDDPRQIRLESDADRVQVVTVHKAKGLEYPLVFLPFANVAREVNGKGPGKEKPQFVKIHDPNTHTLMIHLPPTDESLHRAERERLGEDLRKLYVALTRARYATWCGVAPTKESEASALAYLIGAEAKALDLAPALEQLTQGQPEHIVAQRAPETTDERFMPGPRATQNLQVRDIERPVREAWWIASYSAISHGAGQGAASATEEVTGRAAGINTEIDTESDTARQANFMEDARPATSTNQAITAAKSDTPSLHTFPKGAEPGTFLHDLLEWAARRGFAHVLADREAIEREVVKRCAARDWTDWVPSLADWLHAFLGTALRLDGGRLRLAELETAVPELEFWLSAEQVPVTTLDRLVQQHVLPGATRPALTPNTVNGMLKGFIDLCFEWQGRYYVADYKSNALGPEAGAYTQDAMQAAILQHRYELQYVLYTLALHRLLKARLPGYDYDRHVGGAVYVFLRGLEGPSQGVFHDRPPKALIATLDRLFAGARQAAKNEEVLA